MPESADIVVNKRLGQAGIVEKAPASPAWFSVDGLRFANLLQMQVELTIPHKLPSTLRD
jgi:hypothetical protein